MTDLTDSNSRCKSQQIKKFHNKGQSFFSTWNSQNKISNNFWRKLNKFVVELHFEHPSHCLSLQASNSVTIILKKALVFLM